MGLEDERLGQERPGDAALPPARHEPRAGARHRSAEHRFQHCEALASGSQLDSPRPPYCGRLDDERCPAERVGGARVGRDTHVGALRPQLDGLVRHWVAERVAHRRLNRKRPLLRTAQLEPSRPHVDHCRSARPHHKVRRGPPR